MRTGRPKEPIVLSEEEREQLNGIASSRSLPHGLVRRAHIVLLAAEGMPNGAVAERVGLSPQMVCKWRKRYLRQGLTGLHDELRPGRPRTISDEQVAMLVRKTIETKSQDGTHWAIRSAARDTELSRPAVHRIWRAFGLQPHGQRHFKLSTDPFFVEKVRDIVGLYLNPPDKAMVLWVDERSPIQALDRTQPLLPMGLGYVEGITHDTPTYASWLNEVEIWFNIITQRAIRRGTFRSVKALVAKIEQFVAQYNRTSHPFVWMATADSILEKVRRLCQRVSETGR